MTTTLIRQQFGHYGRLMRIDRPIGTLLLLWPTLWALWIAGNGRPPPALIAIFVLGAFVMRSAGCVVNDMADQRLDRQVRRTRDRPLAAGRVTRREAAVLFLVLILAAAFLASLLNPLALGLSMVGALLAATYPLTKRVTDLPQVYLGVAFGWGIPMAFAAVSGSVPAAAWILLLANVLWAVAYDTMYAMTDREDDIRAGARSSAILFGRADRAWVAACQITMLGTLAYLGVRLGLGPAYYAGLTAAGAFALYQQHLIRHRDPARCFAAFLNNNWLGGAIFLGLWSSYTL